MSNKIFQAGELSQVGYATPRYREKIWISASQSNANYSRGTDFQHLVPVNARLQMYSWESTGKCSWHQFRWACTTTEISVIERGIGCALRPQH